MSSNTYNSAASGNAPLSTRIESHIPGTEARAERKLAESQPGYTGPTSGATGFQGTNTAPMGAPSTNTAATAPGNTAGYNTTAPSVAGGAPNTGGTTMGGHGVADTNVPRGHMGDKVMGAAQANLGRVTNNPRTEEAGLERQSFGDPKHYAGGQGLRQHPGADTTGQAAQQSVNQPQTTYAPSTTQPPTGY